MLAEWKELLLSPCLYIKKPQCLCKLQDRTWRVHDPFFSLIGYWERGKSQAMMCAGCGHLLVSFSLQLLTTFSLLPHWFLTFSPYAVLFSISPCLSVNPQISSSLFIWLAEEWCSPLPSVHSDAGCSSWRIEPSALFVDSPELNFFGLWYTEAGKPKGKTEQKLIQESRQR